jgi:tetratricopeptide (TPR) repeat protein
LALHPEDARLQLRTADVALSTGDLALAAASAEGAYALDRTPAAPILLARVASRAGDPERALGVLRAEIERPGHPPKQSDHTDLLVTLADVQTEQKAHDAARNTLRIALTVAEGQLLPLVHRRLGDLEELLGNPHQAAWERQRAAELER